MSSIREVAKLANVSPATVSRVMNGTANVNEEKKQRVLKAIADTGFVPNAVARSLFKKSSKMIGLIIPSITNPFFTQMASVIEKTADQYGYRLLLYNTDSDFGKEKEAFTLLTSMNADGIILTTNNTELDAFIQQSNIPVVLTDRVFKASNVKHYIHCDHYAGGRMATEHLLECGCKNIVCLKGPQHITSAKARYEGYLDVCKERGIALQTIECDYDFNDGLEKAEQLLELFPDVDGVIACNDMVAISFFKVLHKKGISVPDRIQIIGFDGIYLANLVTPELTTIAQPIEEIGKIAVELIVSESQTEQEREYVLPARLVLGQTTKGKRIGNI